MPSIVTLVASVVRQFSTTGCPRSMFSGSAVMLAVGAGRELGALPFAGGCGASFFLQPVAARSAKAALATTVFQTVTRVSIIVVLLLKLYEYRITTKV